MRAIVRNPSVSGDVGEPIAPVDLRAQPAGLDKLREQLQISGGDVGLYLGDVLPPRSETPSSLACSTGWPGGRSCRSHTQGLIDRSRSIMERHAVAVDELRAVDTTSPPGCGRT